MRRWKRWPRYAKSSPPSSRLWIRLSDKPESTLSVSSFTVHFGAEIFDQRKTAGDGKQQDLLRDGLAVPRRLAGLLGIRLRLKDHHGGELGEVGAAFVAPATVVLDILASRAGEPQRMVAARAELDSLQVLMPAFGALQQ